MVAGSGEAVRAAVLFLGSLVLERDNRSVG